MKKTYFTNTGFGAGEAPFERTGTDKGARRGRPDASRLSREACVRLLENVGIQCYDEESAATLRKAVEVNVADGTITRIDFEEAEVAS